MNITVYTLPNCVQCNQTKKLLDKLELQYEVVDASTSEEGYRYITEILGYKQAPVVVVANDKGETIEHWSGFQLEQLQELK